ncbi:MAG: putative site-specific recombinase [Pseudomonadota bacterium]|jgi:integrase/recombinase XerC
MSSDADLVEKYLEHVRVGKRLAARTVELYALDLARLQSNAQAGGVGLLQVQTAHVRRWVAQMHGGGRSGRGIALILSGWRGFYAWLGREGLIAHNPVADVRAPKSPRPLPKALSVDDAVQLAAYQDTQADPWREARDAALVELLYGGGLRVGELVGLDVVASAGAKGWVDADAGQAHVLGKGGKRRTVPVGAAALQALARWQSVRNGPQAPAPCRSPQADAAALFTGPRGQRLTPQAAWKALRERSLRAGLAAPVHPHMLRHSFASHVLQSSGDLRAVQEMLGHASIATTQVYTRLDFQHLAQAYDAAHPRARRKG